MATKQAAFSRPADRYDALETIALVLRAGALANPIEDLEGLKRAGFTVVRNAPASSAVHSTPGAREAVQ